MCFFTAFIPAWTMLKSILMLSSTHVFLHIIYSNMDNAEINLDISSTHVFLYIIYSNMDSAEINRDA